MSGQEQSDPRGGSNAFEGSDVTVYFDQARCIHAAECVKGLPAVFDPKNKPWVNPDGAEAQSVVEVVQRCPSGALHFELKSGDEERPVVPTRVEPQVDGPVYLAGDLRIVLDQGVLSETRASMCRCGRSGNKPFCDKTCERSGWSSTWHPPAE